jgi:hypothetical protein
MFDKQITDLGRKHLTSQLLKAGVEVLPISNNSEIDIVARLSRNNPHEVSFACPIKIRPSKDARFGVQRIYEETKNLLIVHVWDVLSNDPEVFALTYSEAVALLDKRGHTMTRSWKVLGGYSPRTVGGQSNFQGIECTLRAGARR